MTLVRTEINRRSFLKVSAAGGAGLMIGFNWLASCTPSTRAEDVPEEWFDINAFITIADNGEVTIYSPNPEIGQNVKTSMPMVVAEELDCNWGEVVVKQASLNTEKYTRQVAGGSQSIRQGWNSLRMAGATARRMLLEAAARQWEVSIDALSTDKGIIKNNQTGETIGYGKVATAAVSITPPEKIKLKDPKDFKLIGTYVKNVDGPKIVTGQPLFGLDYKVDGMKTAMIVHPPAFGLKLGDFDATGIKSMLGITDVFKINTRIESDHWSATNAFPELIAIVGESTWQVMKAKKALQVQWEKDTPLENTEGHVALMEKALNGKLEVQREDGDADKVMKDAARILERTYTAPVMAHNSMEPINFFAHVTAEKAELAGPIQTPEALREMASDLLGFPKEKVTVDMTRMGGGFGRRLYGHFGLEAAMISKQAGVPIKLVYSREDDMTQGTYRPAYRVTYKAGLDNNNNVISFHVKGTGVSSNPLFPNRFPAGAIKNYKAEGTNNESNISFGAWRAPRSHFTAGAEQSFLDELAELAGKDPIDFRLELFDRAIKNPVGENNDYDAERYAGVLKLVKEKANWGQDIPGIAGRGVSAYYCHNSYVAQVVDVDSKQNIKNIWCAVDCGIVVNYEGAINQIEGGMIDGIGHTLYSRTTFDRGEPLQKNFDKYQLIRHIQALPDIKVFFVKNEIDPTGLGEPSLPPISAAVANAYYQATGKRYYHQPFTLAKQEDEIRLG